MFHSVHWTREYKGGAVFGEADFIVLDRAGEALVIEQKNGRLEESEAGLRKSYRNGGSSDPFAQVRRSLDNIKEKFSRTHGRDGRLVLDYLVYCPDHRVTSVNAVGVDASRFVDASTDRDLARKIRDVLPVGTDDPARRERVEKFFLDSFEVYPDVHAYRRASEECSTRLGDDFFRNLCNIGMTPLRLRVSGSPGCGKTVVARRFFERAVDRGRKPLLVCFNRDLKEKIGANVPPGGLVETWYGLLHKFLESKGRAPDFDRRRPDSRFWADVQDRVVAETVDDDWSFDTAIVDEGQDFEQEWVDVLELFMRDDADVLWLEARDQGIRRGAPVALDGFVTYDQRKNHRSPVTVARFMRKALPFEFEPANDMPGLGVGVESYRDRDDQARLVAKTVNALLKRGFAPEDIVILSLRGVRNTGLAGRDRVGSHALRRVTGDYDRLGNQTVTDGRLRLDSVHRFKGQQAPAVVVIDVESGGRNPALVERLLYAAFSRATARLDVTVAADDPLAARLLAAAP